MACTKLPNYLSVIPAKAWIHFGSAPRSLNWTIVAAPMLTAQPAVAEGPYMDEPCMRAIRKAKAGCYVFLVFMLRAVSDKTLLRPISACDMHRKETDRHAGQIKTNAHTPK